MKKAILCEKSAIFVIAGLVLLGGCGGNSLSTSENQAPRGNNPGSSQLGGNGGVSAGFNLLIRDTPPTNLAVLSFSITVTGANLQPGNISLLEKPVSVELSRLPVEMALLATGSVPQGNYDHLTVTIANPSLTILNNSMIDYGSCSQGAICKLKPSISGFSGDMSISPALPIPGDPGIYVWLLDFDFSRISSDLETMSPVAIVQQISADELNQLGVHVKQMVGGVSHVISDPLDGISYDLATDAGTLGILDDSVSTQYVDAGERRCYPLFPFYCLEGSLVEADLSLKLTPWIFGPTWMPDKVRVMFSDRPELEGQIAGIHGEGQFDMVLLQKVPDVPGVEIGDPIQVNLPLDATFEAVDFDLPKTGLLFSAPSDLLIGQVVSIRVLSAPSGTPLAVEVDRVRLKRVAFTARVQSILNATDFIVDRLPANFPSAEVLVRTNSQIDQTNSIDTSELAVADIVSVSGYMLKSLNGPVLAAEYLRRR